MVKIDPDDLLTVAQAAELRSVTRQAINHLIREGKLSVVEIAGRRFVKRSDVMSFEPDKGGRPAKAKKATRKAKAKRK
ncbi:MAG TPA: helix-turn-helix domain-containing protein [Blastocatellia bacterium]|nr:helix-turn-helix domain-containing protein [Blastocatellia bacterium]